MAQVELPSGAAGDDQFGGCRTVEHSYVKNKQIGEGTYGQVSLPRLLCCALGILPHVHSASGAVTCRASSLPAQQTYILHLLHGLSSAS